MPDTLTEIRERDANVPWTASVIGTLPTPTAEAAWSAFEDRRALLAHIDALTAAARWFADLADTPVINQTSEFARRAAELRAILGEPEPRA